MNGRLSSLHRGRAFIASFVAVAFSFSIAIAVSPQLHAWVHPDANKAEHTCVATLISSGSYEHGSPAPVVIPFSAPSQLSVIDSFNQRFVESAFLGASIFEHAPPLCS
jgi:hypothetical protein